jgi:hypothetical protein
MKMADEESGMSLPGTVSSPLNEQADSFTPTLMAEVGRKPSIAYKNSKRESHVRNLQLDAQGKSVSDFEFKTVDGEDDGAPITTTTTPYKKLLKIGKKTACMAFCLLSFGLAMIITSFVVIHQIEGSKNAFYLFLVIGIFAVIPGAYASYHVVGKFLGWYVLYIFFFLFIVCFLYELIFNRCCFVVGYT